MFSDFIVFNISELFFKYHLGVEQLEFIFLDKFLLVDFLDALSHQLLHFLFQLMFFFGFDQINLFLLLILLSVVHLSNLLLQGCYAVVFQHQLFFLIFFHSI